jgi:3-hydroxymyristoyl/3-hydroxydecanoyl-(acyl carrier protein) dehydratase
MNRAKLLELLPYGDAFLWIDRCFDVEPGRSIRAEMHYRSDHPFLDAHFAKGPKLVPGCLIVEQVCQAALALAISENESKVAYLLGRVQATFERMAPLSSTVLCEVTIKPSATGVIMIDGSASVTGVGRIAQVKAMASPITGVAW